MATGTDRELIETVLLAYDLGRLQDFRHHAGTAAKTWRLHTSVGQYLLRTRGSRTSADPLIAFDHALRRHLLAAGIPTAAPLPGHDGRTFVRCGERAFEVYPIVAGSPLQETLVVELANGCEGYLPTARAFAEGGYETRLARSSKLTPETGEAVVEQATELLKEIA